MYLRDFKFWQNLTNQAHLTNLPNLAGKLGKFAQIASSARILEKLSCLC